MTMVIRPSELGILARRLLRVASTANGPIWSFPIYVVYRFSAQFYENFPCRTIAGFRLCGR
jgi:hypothetical protein